MFGVFGTGQDVRVRSSMCFSVAGWGRARTVNLSEGRFGVVGSER